MRFVNYLDDFTVFDENVHLLDKNLVSFFLSTSSYRKYLFKGRSSPSTKFFIDDEQICLATKKITPCIVIRSCAVYKNFQTDNFNMIITLLFHVTFHNCIFSGDKMQPRKSKVRSAPTKIKMSTTNFKRNFEFQVCGKLDVSCELKVYPFLKLIHKSNT